MDVKLIHIEPLEAGPVESADDVVRIRLEVDGVAAEHQLTVVSSVVSGSDAVLLVASDALQDLFKGSLVSLHRICKLVGQDLQGQPIHLPQRIAA